MPTRENQKVPARLMIAGGAGSVEIEAAAAGDEQKLRGFSMVAYTGGPMRLRGFYYPVVIDLAGLKASKKSRPVLRDHDPSLIVGHSEQVTIGAQKITVTGKLSGANDQAREVAESSDNGFPWRASIGANAERMVFLDKGEKLEVNGRRVIGPAYVVRAGTLMEISFVALGADDNTSAKVAASAAEQQIEVISMNFEQWLKAKGFDPEQLSDSQRTSLQAMFDAEQNPNPPGDPESETKPPVQASASTEEGETEDPLREMRARRAAEIERGDRIAQICAQYDGPKIKVDGAEVSLEAHAIKEGWDETKVELHALRAARPAAPAIHTDTGTQRTGTALEASLCLTAGMDEEQVGKWYDEKTMNAAASRDLRGAGIREVFIAVLQAAGAHVGFGRLDDDFIRAAFQADRQIQASSGFSTVSLSGVLGNVANKALLAAYRGVDSVVERFCAIRPVNDFKQVTSYRLTGDGTFQKVGADGELKSMTLGEENFSNQAATFGRIVSLTREMIINDDLGAFLQLPRMLGRGGALSLQEAVYSLLLSNPNSFFSLGNKNLLSGADSVLGIDGLTKAEQTFMDQVDADGKPVAITPGVLLTPSSLKTLGNQLYEDRVVNETTTANKPKPISNPHAGKFTPYATPYLNNSSFTGNSATAWYLFANPADVAAMEICFLRGRGVPTIQQGETSFNVLGMQWRGFFDFGVAMQDSRAAVKNAGA